VKPKPRSECQAPSLAQSTTAVEPWRTSSLIDAAQLTPEDRLLLLAACWGIREADREPIELVVPRVRRWDYVLEAAERHGVAPLLHHALSDVSTTTSRALPHHVLNDLAALERASRARSERLFALVREVARDFARADVAVLALKEIQLAAAVYADPALRPIGDLDLLIRREDYEQAANLLDRLGFKAHPTEELLYAARYGMGHNFHRASDDAWIDLQWNVAQREWDAYGEGTFTYDPSGMWERSAAVSANRLEIRAPSPEDMLFHLCLHLEGHSYAELILFSDIANLVSAAGDSINWSALVACARSYGAESSVYYALLLTSLLLRVSAPADVMRQLEPAYFGAGLFPAIFGNLGALHESLDEINALIGPPSRLQRTLEAAVRRQTAQAMLVHGELDAFAHAFLEADGTAICFDSSPSPRRYPDDRLEPFGQIDAFVLDSDLEALVRAFEKGGWTRADHSAMWRTRIRRQSRDPLVDSVSVDLEVTLESDLGPAVERKRREPSKSRALAHALRPRRRPAGEALISVRAHVLPADELATALAVRLSRSEARLFRLVGAWRLLQRLGSVSPSRVAELAAPFGLQSEANAGASLVSSALGGASGPVRGSDEGSITFLFRTARDVSTERPFRRAAKAVYLYTLPLLAERGARPRLEYIRASMERRGGRAVLWRLLSDLCVSAIAQIRIRRAPRRSYWADSSDAGVRMNSEG
jgi:Uncharacterised nucleotidyltransferase